MSQLNLVKNGTETLADFPRITENYSRSDTKHLYKDRVKMKEKADKPASEWEEKFAHLHVQAIDEEIKKRRNKMVIHDE